MYLWAFFLFFYFSLPGGAFLALAIDVFVSFTGGPIFFFSSRRGIPCISFFSEIWQHRIYLIEKIMVFSCSWCLWWWWYYHGFVDPKKLGFEISLWVWTYLPIAKSYGYHEKLPTKQGSWHFGKCKCVTQHATVKSGSRAREELTESTGLDFIFIFICLFTLL